MFIKVLGFLTAVVPFAFEFIDKKFNSDLKEEDHKIYSRISTGLVVIGIIYSFANIFWEDVIFSFFFWLQDYLWIAGGYVLLSAILPPVIAMKERNKGTFSAKNDYALKNGIFNLLGIAAANAVFNLFRNVVADITYLRYFYLNDLIPIIAGVTVSMVITYQKLEQKKGKKNELDHDPSLQHLNQKLNLVHLFNAYFLAIISVIFLVTYTIYCDRYGIHLEVNAPAFYFLITVALIFFYMMLNHELRYLYLLAVIIIPVIMISCVYYMSWLTQKQEERIFQWLFVFIHTMIYTLTIFFREKVIEIRKHDDGADCDGSKGLRFLKWDILCENVFLMVVPFIIGIIYIVVFMLPLQIERLPMNEAHNYIDLICESTDMDVNAIIAMAEEQEMYNNAAKTYDVEAFLQFLSDELGKQMVEKGIVEKEGDIPTRNDLSNYLVNVPRAK